MINDSTGVQICKYLSECVEIYVHLVVRTTRKAEARDAWRELCSSPCEREGGKSRGLISLL